MIYINIIVIPMHRCIPTLAHHQPFVDIAVSSLPDIGADFYKQCLKFHTSTDMTVSEIHELGLSEVARIELEMMEIVKELGYTNITLQEFTEMIRCSRNKTYKFSKC